MSPYLTIGGGEEESEIRFPPPLYFHIMKYRLGFPYRNQTWAICGRLQALLPSSVQTGLFSPFLHKSGKWRVWTWCLGTGSAILSLSTKCRRNWSASQHELCVFSIEGSLPMMRSSSTSWEGKKLFSAARLSPKSVAWLWNSWKPWCGWAAFLRSGTWSLKCKQMM